MTNPDLVIFDCDGVLIDSEVISARMLIAELAHYDIHIDMSYVVRHFLGRSYPIVLKQIRSEFGIVLPDGFEADYRQRLVAAFARDLKIMPDVRDVIDNLDVPYCLATSSSPPRLAESLRIVGLTDAFENRTNTASEVANGKPAPDLFLHVARKFGVEPANCLVIEDSHAGVQAGLAAGMEVWQFLGGSHLDGLVPHVHPGTQAHRTFASFKEFFQICPSLKRDDPDHDAAQIR